MKRSLKSNKNGILQNEENEILRKIDFIPEPTYSFEVGEQVRCGLCKNVRIVEKLCDGKYYKISQDIVADDGTITTEYSYRQFYNLRPMNVAKESFIKNKDVYINFANMSIYSILNKKYFFGIDMEPDYQRDYVWSEEDKVALIDSIFNNVDIGKFAFVINDYGCKFLYQVLDGKQRVNAITDFYENKFQYNGKFFNELSIGDQSWFEEYHIAVAEIDNCDKKTILKYFLLLNTGGKIMDENHLDKVRTILKNYKEEN